MRTSKKSRSVSNNTNNQPTGATVRDLQTEADVLFQRIFDKWYKFTVLDDNCLVSPVSEDEVYRRMGRKMPRPS